MPKIHAYLRVSSPRQVASGLSLDQQKHQLKRYIDFLLESDGYKHLERGEFLVEEGVSASKVQLLLRPEGMKLRTILEPGDHVCFSKPDRCFRSVSDLVSTVKHWEPHNIAMHFETLRIDTSTPHGAMILQIMISVAEWEAAVNRERVMDAIEARKRDKYAIQFGACPIGYKRVRKNGKGIQQVCKDSLRIMRWITKQRDEEGLEYRQISDLLEEHLAERENREPLPEVSFGRRRKFDRQRVRAWYVRYKEHGDEIELDFAQLRQGEHPHGGQTERAG